MTQPRRAIGSEASQVVMIQRRGRSEANNAEANASARTTEAATITGLAPGGAVLAAQSTNQGAKSGREWDRFMKKYRAEMATPESRATLDLLAALSHRTDFSVGCYCSDESRCHRSVLRALLLARGAKVM